MKMDRDTFVETYLERLGVLRPKAPDASALRTLQAAHLHRVPFENLDIHLVGAISLDLDLLADKILSRHRGGFCYELNGLFAELLSTLGFEVTLLAARVWTGTQFGPPLDHLVLRVQCPESWLVDVGFGSHSHYPLRLETDVDQPDPGGLFRVEPAGEDDFDVVKNGVVQYRVEAHSRMLPDFEAMCWYQEHSPRSHFTQQTVCSMLTNDGGRITLTSDRLISDGKDETFPPDDASLLEAYRTIFGIELSRVPKRA
jgi:N-hydroxyarylamine O-acetyltransferase